MHIIKIVKTASSGSGLNLYNEDLDKIESEAFDDLYTLNFHLQTLVKKYGVQKALVIVHDKDQNTVNMLVAKDENSFFIS